MSAVLTDAVLEALADSDNDYQRASLLLRKRCREDSRLLLAIVDPWINGSVSGMVAKVAQTYGIADRFSQQAADSAKNDAKSATPSTPSSKSDAALSAQQIDQVVQAWGHTQPDAVSVPSNASVSVISQLTKPIERPPSLGKIAAKRQQETLGQLAAAYKKS